jgi:hypothetical protein
MELLLTTSFVHTSSGFSDEIVPAIHVVGTPAGFRWLSVFLAGLADRGEDGLDDDGDHTHLRDAQPPCNLSYTDEIDVIFRRFTDTTRSRFVRQQGVTRSVKKRGTPVTQFSKLLGELAPYILLEAKGNRRFRAKWLHQYRLLAEQLDGVIRQLELPEE